MFSSLFAEAKALSSKFDASQQNDLFSKYRLDIHSIRIIPSAEADIPNSAAPEFIHDPKTEELDEFSYFETFQLMFEVFGKNLFLFRARFDYLKHQIE